MQSRRSSTFLTLGIVTVCLRTTSEIRGIAISSFGMNGDVEKSMQAGFSEHLVKPVDLERLEAAIEHAMSVSC